MQITSTAKRLAEGKIRKTIRNALPKIESELKDYLSEVAEEKALELYILILTCKTGCVKRNF